MNNTFTFYYDPGHAWLEVSQTDINDVGLNDTDFSRYSYTDKQNLYLEEDCDAGIFINAYEAKHGSPPIIVEKEDVTEKIRNFDRLQGK